MTPGNNGSAAGGVGDRPDVVIIMTDEERAAPPYESDDLTRWRHDTLTARKWFDNNGVSFARHYTGSLACVPSRPTIFTGHYPDVHGVSQTDGLGKMANDSRMRWLREGEVPTLGHWFRLAGYDTHYDGKWHITHADLIDPETGEALASNDDAGVVDSAAVRRYLEADQLDAFGFSGWVGPEPHGAGLANSGLRRDPLIADRVVAWLEDRYARRAAGDASALRPFLLVASFVNPHDIVLFPAWNGRRNPMEPSPLDPPPVASAPTADEDLRTKPAAQVAYRASYPSGYGPAAAVGGIYDRNGPAYREVYYRLHAEVDAPIDRVRRAVTEGGSENAVLVRTSDHGDLLGSHGGLHQKWFTLYDEATRVPFVIARIGADATAAATVADMATSHTDLLPTLLAAAGADQDALAEELRSSFSEVHPLPGRDLLPVVGDPSAGDRDRAVYLQTRDNMLEGDSGASGIARRLGRTAKPPAPLRISVPAHVAANFEAVVARVGEAHAEGGSDHLWKLVRTFDDPATWTEPGVRHLAATGPGGPTYRTEALPDQWELYDLDADPVEAHNLAFGLFPSMSAALSASSGGASGSLAPGSAAAVFAHMKQQLTELRRVSLPERNEPWPYAAVPADAPINGGSPMTKNQPPPPARLVRKVIQRLGMHPDDTETLDPGIDMAGRRALVIATNHGRLDIGKPTGVFASEMTVPYYAFLDAGVEVDIASPLGGDIPVDPQSLKPVLRTAEDDRFLGDDVLRGKVAGSLDIAEVDIATYDIVFLAGGWGAAFDLGFSESLAHKITEANAEGRIIGGVCHGPLGLRNALAPDGRPLVEGRRVTAVTDKQVRELGISATPHHPETELRAKGALFESETKFRDPFANHWVVDDNLVTGQNQNAGPMVAREMLRLAHERFVVSGEQPLRVVG